RKAAAAGSERTRARRSLAGEAGRLRQAGAAAEGQRRRDLERLALALAAHDPQRTLARGYALVESEGDALVTSAAEARAAGALALRFHDGRVRANVEDPEP
ncbi:MAG TPA: exodeoxyribonuclease VII large subunit, partial [Conexibacter sp.]|nr:exodeoxyribonuclease VII large subunit [Conexibacter sp.]